VAAALREEMMTLEELRKSREFSQEEVAAALAVGQPAVAKLEKRADMRLSNLRRYVEALGGRLEIAAHFGRRTWWWMLGRRRRSKHAHGSREKRHAAVRICRNRGLRRGCGGARLARERDFHGRNCEERRAGVSDTRRVRGVAEGQAARVEHSSGH
jgi:transcriptional regulator with XRE-family HTH domain